MEALVILILGVISTLVFNKLYKRDEDNQIITICYFASFSIALLAVPASFFGLMAIEEIYKTIYALSGILFYGCGISIYHTIIHYHEYRRKRKKEKPAPFSIFMLHELFEINL